MVIYLVGMHKSGTVTRCCRVAWSLGIDMIRLVDSVLPERRYLYSAKSIHLSQVDDIREDTLIFEPAGKIPVHEIDWSTVRSVAVGGSTINLDIHRYRSAKIISRNPCLIGDQVLAIALYARMTGIQSCL